MEMFPEVDKVIIEDLYTQVGNDKEALVEAIMSL